MTPQATTEPNQAAERALTRLAELSADLRAAAIVDSACRVLASSGPGEGWAEQAGELIAAAREAGGDDFDRVHLGTLDGEVFAVPDGELICIAITERFTLGSLVIFDMRMILRDLARELGEAT